MASGAAASTSVSLGPAPIPFQEVRQRAAALDEEALGRIRMVADRYLAGLLGLEWLLIVAFTIWKPWWADEQAAAVGGLIACAPAILTWRCAGHWQTRHLNAVAQMLMAGLLVSATGGHPPAHFLHSGLLVALAFHYDWRVLVSATVVAVCGNRWPTLQSFPDQLEQSGWVALTSAALVILVLYGRKQMRESAYQLAQMEIVSGSNAAEVESRTESLRKSEDIYALVFRNSPLPMWLCDPESKQILDVNEQASTVFGYRDEAFRRMRFFDLLPPEEIAEAERALDPVFHGDRAVCLLVKHRKEDGAVGYVEITAHRADFAGSSAVLMVGNDITARKEAERVQEEMEVQRRHAQKLESIGQLASGIAHEINTPTQYIGDNLHFLREAFEDLHHVIAMQNQALALLEDSFPTRTAALRELYESIDMAYLIQEVPRSLDQALEGVERVSTLVKAMKEFSHPGRKEKALSDINQAIQSTVTVTRNEWKYFATLETDLQPDLPLVPCLLSDFNQVVLNLIVNSAQAIHAKYAGTGELGHIRITTRALADCIEVCVADTGCGIPEEIRGRVFDPFFTTKDVGRGTGQGLAIARSVVVDKHGGSIHFESDTGLGTVFTIRLPLAQPATNVAPRAAA